MGPRRILIAVLLLMMSAPQLAMTEAVAPIGMASLSQIPLHSDDDRRLFLQPRSALAVQTRSLYDPGAIGPGDRAPSLFAGQSESGMFAPMAPRPVAMRQAAPFGGAGIDQLRQIIGQAESRLHGYDAVQHGARIRPGKRPTQMTLAEIFAWVDATPNQPHAIGRYQFIPTTLDWLVGRLDLHETAIFSPELQDRLADLLLADAGFQAYRSGDLPRETFMNNLAKIWAGLPTSQGVSYYDGYAGNRASLSWAEFDAQMAQIRW